MDQDTTKKHCSFCGTTGDETTGLWGGLGAFICGDCIELFAGGLARRQETGEEPPQPWESLSDTHLLSRMWLIERTAMQAEEFLAEWAQMTRARGVSWAEIGKALAIPARVARARFSAAGSRA
jgi:hypothetical protein